MRRILRFGLTFVMMAIAAIALGNSSLWTTPETKPTLLAHRGLAQTYGTAGLTATTCTASRILPPEHSFIENTLPSMRAAFAAGADIVELDVHPTTDGQIAVFHDWTLDCRTDGRGVTREHSLADLKKLDVGFGYTSDGGKSYPLRGTGIGLLPSLDEVLSAFPDKRFLIHIKSNDADEGRRLATRLKSLPPQQLQRLMIYGGALPVAEVRQIARCTLDVRRDAKTLPDPLCSAGLVRLHSVRLRTQRAAGAGQLCAVALGLAEPVSQPDASSWLGSVRHRPLRRRGFFKRDRQV